VILARVTDGFIAELTYGENVNWYRNSVAAGGCVVVSHGSEDRVTQIEPCTPERGRSAYPPLFRPVLTVTGRAGVRLLRTDSAAARDDAAEAGRLQPPTPPGTPGSS